MVLDKSTLSSSAETTIENLKQLPAVRKIIQPPTITPFYVHFLAGGISGTIGAMLTCPLEVVKTRFQSSYYRSESPRLGVSLSSNPLRMISFHINGTLQAVRQVYLQEGLLALWKGIGATVIGVMPSRAIYFSSYNKGKAFLSELNDGRENTLVHLGAASMSGQSVLLLAIPFIWSYVNRNSNGNSNESHLAYQDTTSTSEHSFIEHE
jgi:Mitochondrial carrier protein